MAKKRALRKTSSSPKTERYRHTDAKVLLRPDVGTQREFKKKKAPATYRYDSSLSPSLAWDGQNPGREEGEALIAGIGARPPA